MYELYVLTHYDDFYFIVAENDEQALKRAKQILKSDFSDDKWITSLHNIKEHELFKKRFDITITKKVR